MTRVIIRTAAPLGGAGYRLAIGTRWRYVRLSFGGSLPEHWRGSLFSRNMDRSRGGTFARLFAWRHYPRHCWHLTAYPFTLTYIWDRYGFGPSV